MPKAKATKKFEKKHLTDAIKRRNEVAKVKQKNHTWAKKKGTPKYEDGADGAKAPGFTGRKPTGLADEEFAGMAKDEFFEDRVDVPEPDKKQKKKAEAKKQEKKRQKLEEAKEEESDDDDDDEFEDELDGGSEDETIAGEDDSEDNEGSDAESDIDMDKHKNQLDSLKEKDPEFFKFLQENDSELLNFTAGDDLELSESENENEDAAGADQSDSEGEKVATEKKSRTLTEAMVAKWKSELDGQKSLRVLREVAVAFRAAANVNLDSNKTDKVYRYSITNPDVYHQLLVVALTDFPKVLQHHIPLIESKAAGKVRIDQNSKHFRSLTPILKSHVAALEKLIASLSDDASLRLTLDSLFQIVPYVLSFKKGIKELIKTVVDVWSNPGNSEAVRISAFLVLQRITVIADAGTREATLKTIYQGLVKGSRNTTVYTIQGINLMKNSAAQLWGIDSNAGYSTGFGFIRQLAIHLRTSITQNANEAYKAVYNWQYIHSLDFWSRVVSTHCNALVEAERGQESALRPLIYPIVQLTLGAMRLIPTAQYFPLRFQLIRSLTRISSSTSTYIPLGPALFEVLNSAEMRKPAKPSTAKGLEFETLIRAPKAYLGTRVYQDGVGEEVAELLSEVFVLWSTHVSFPELSLPVVVMIKRWIRDVSNLRTGNRNGKINQMISLVVQKLESNGRYIEGERAKVDFAPNNRSGVEGFSKGRDWKITPLGGYVVAQRVMRDERRKMLEASRKEGKGSKHAGEDGEDENEGGKSRRGGQKKTNVPAGVFEHEETEDEDEDEDEDEEMDDESDSEDDE